MPIKLTNILNELNINNPNITVEKVYDYYMKNIFFNNDQFNDQYGDDSAWQKYKEICYPYCQKYDIVHGWIGLSDEFKKLSQSDLNKFYREMRSLVRKHVGTEILNELNVNNPNISIDTINKYYGSKILPNPYLDDPIIQKYIQICKPYCKKYKIKGNYLGYDEFYILSQSDLNKLYSEMKNIT